MLSGISFLEFAVDEASAAALGALLQRLGFRRAGEHRSKAVTLYRCGDIHFVLNADPNGVAHEHFVEHGASICAVALRTDDPVRSLNRAVAVAMAQGPAAGLSLVDDLAAAGDLDGYHLLHSARADLYRRLGESAEAAQAYRRALALVSNDSERRFLERRLREVEA